jgi:hypothetical protein
MRHLENADLDNDWNKEKGNRHYLLYYGNLRRTEARIKQTWVSK